MSCTYMSHMCVYHRVRLLKHWQAISSRTRRRSPVIVSFSVSSSATRSLREVLGGSRHRECRWAVRLHACTYINICARIHIHMYILSYAHTHDSYIHTYIQTDKQTYIHTYMHSYIPTYIHSYIPTYIYTYTHICICIYGYV